MARAPAVRRSSWRVKYVFTRGLASLDRIDQPVTGPILQQIAAGSQGNRGRQRGIVVVGKTSTRANPGLSSFMRPYGGQAVAVRQADVQEYDVHFVSPTRTSRPPWRWPPRRRPDRGLCQQALERRHKHFMVVGNQ